MKKIKIFLFLFLFPSHLFAQEDDALEKRNVATFEEAKSLSQAQRYEESLASLDRSFRLQQDPLKTPRAVLELAAYNFENMRSYKAAITHLYIIINRTFSISHSEIEELYRNNKVEEFNELRKKLPEDQTRIYFQIARLYSHILNDNLYDLPREEILDAETKGLFYYRLSYLKNPEEAMKGITAIEEIQRDNVLRKYKARWYLPTFINIWQDAVEVTNSQVSEKVVGSAQTLSFGVGYRRENKYQGFHLELAGFYGRSDVDKKNSVTNYRSTKNTISGFIISPGFIGHAFVRNLIFGIETPLLYKKGSYEKAAGSFSVSDQSFITPGILGMVAATSKKIDLVLKFGRFLNLEGPFVSFGLNFNL